jgi:hypothetical protein
MKGIEGLQVCKCVCPHVGMKALSMESLYSDGMEGMDTADLQTRMPTRELVGIEE